MKTHLIALCATLSLLATLPSFSAVQLQVHASPILGLWSFITTVADFGRHPSPQLAEIFQKSKYASDPVIKTKISELHRIHEQNFDQSYTFRGFPAARTEMGWDIDKYFEYQASQSLDLPEFESRVTALLPPSEQLRMFQILKTMNEIYQELLWKPYAQKLDLYGKKLLDTWTQGHLSELLTKTAVFYRAKWPEPFNVTIHMIPIPASGGHTHATVIADAIIMDALVDEKDIAGRVGVIFHELCHSAYRAESAQDQKQVIQWIEKNKSPFRPYAESLLDEGLPTALGNGLAYKLITGKEDESSWYDVDEFDKGAKAESELIRSYVLAAKPIDEAFMDKWVDVYAKKFPDALNDPNIRFRHATLLIDESAMTNEEARSAMKKLMRFADLYTHPLMAKDRLDNYEQNAAILIIGNKKSLPEIETLSATFPILKNLLDLYKKTPTSSVIAGFSKDQPVVLFRVEKPEDFKELFKRVVTGPALPRNPSVVIQSK